MPAQRRRFTLEEKLDILQQAKQSGITTILHKHNLSYSVFHRWKEMLAERGREDMKINMLSNSKMKDILEENTLLKKIIANQAMLLELKEEELRKRQAE